MPRRLDENRVSSNAAALTRKFKERIVGQADGTQALIHIVERWLGGFYDKTRPIGTALFLGPTGSGKTSTVEAFAEGLYGSPRNFIRVDCAEFQHSQEIARIIGSPPGYLGHKDTKPFFTNEKILAMQSEKFPFTVILWDEIEKANTALWQLMLGILDKAEMTTGSNIKVDFRNTIHVMTSNVGSVELSEESGLGFGPKDVVTLDKNSAKIAKDAAGRKFMPEFLNRIDEIVVYKALTEEQANKILTFELGKLQRQIILDAAVSFGFDVTPAARAELLKRGFSRKENARQMRRMVETYVTRPLSNIVVTNQIAPLEVVRVDFINGEWRYFAADKDEQSSIYEGLVEVSTVLEPGGVAPAPRPVRKPTRARRAKKPTDPVLALS